MQRSQQTGQFSRNNEGLKFNSYAKIDIESITSGDSESSSDSDIETNSDNASVITNKKPIL